MSTSPTLEDVMEAYLASVRQGCAESVEAYAARYPELEAELLELLPAAQLIERAGLSSTRTRYPDRIAWPKALGEFTLLEKLGQGGMGTVFKARQESLNRLVAIKILAPSLAMEKRQREQFQNESKVIASLHHTNIVEVYGAGYDQGFCFYVMELIKGHGMTLEVTDGTPQQVARLGLQVAEALSYAHSRHILHRDIKPGNLLLDGENNIHLSDFGLATWLPENGVEAMATQTQEGTLRYMAPETLLHGTYNFATDQYALGVTLYELRSRHAAVSATVPGQVVHHICETGLPPLKVRDDIDCIINKCTAFAAKDRYATVAELAADLRRYLAHKPILAHRPTLSRRLVLWAKRRPTIAALTGASIVLSLLFVSAVVTGLIILSQSYHRETLQRQRAEAYASLSEKTLDRVFAATSPMDATTDTPALKGVSTELLGELLPYYTQAAHLRNWPQERLTETRRVLGMLALEAGNASLAEQMFDSITTTANSVTSAKTLNAKAIACARQDKAKDAETLWSQIVKTYAKDPAVNTRLEVIKALRNLAAEKPYATTRKRYSRARLLREEASPYLRQAAEILTPILVENPTLPEALFLAATLLIDAPELALFLPDNYQTCEPFDILAELIQDNPENENYRCELLRAALRLSHPETNTLRIQTALMYADALLVAHPYDIALINDTIQLYEKIIEQSLDRKRTKLADAHLAHATSIFTLVASQKNTSTQAQDAILTFIIRQYRLSARLPERTQSLKLCAESILKYYTGDKKTVFTDRLALPLIEKNTLQTGEWKQQEDLKTSEAHFQDKLMTRKQQPNRTPRKRKNQDPRTPKPPQNRKLPPGSQPPPEEV